jgi:DNA-binding transcriptional ArsR family regulator
MGSKTSGAAAARHHKSRAQDARLGALGAQPVERVAPEPQQVATPNLDRLIHERMRLGIVSALAVNPSLTFNELKALLGTTDGNLCIHARKLEEAAYIISNKSLQVRLPGRLSKATRYRLTAAGRRALERYLDHMEALIRATRDR